MKLYTLFAFISYLIRNYCFSNPFSPLGEIGDGINLLFGFLLIPITYIIVGLVYRKNSYPLLGSILFIIIYSVNSCFTYFVMKIYPAVYLIIILVVAYLFLMGYIAYKINSNIY